MLDSIQILDLWMIVATQQRKLKSEMKKKDIKKIDSIKIKIVPIAPRFRLQTDSIKFKNVNWLHSSDILCAICCEWIQLSRKFSTSKINHQAAISIKFSIVSFFVHCLLFILFTPWAQRPRHWIAFSITIIPLLRYQSYQAAQPT